MAASTSRTSVPGWSRIAGASEHLVGFEIAVEEFVKSLKGR
jgi:hypothetical protein